MRPHSRSDGEERDGRRGGGHAARRTILARMDRLFDAGDRRTRARPGRRAARRRPTTGRSPRACARGTLDGLRRPGAPARRGLGAAHRDRVRPPALDGPVRPARARARPRSRGSSPSTPTPPSRSSRPSRPAAPRCARCIERARQRRDGGRAHDLLPRRDPPLQQGPAGRAAARGRGGARDADRRHHREPVLRGQLRAALAHAGLRAARARPPRTSRGCCARALERGECGDVPGRRRGASSSSPRAPAATPAPRSTRSSSRARPRRDGRASRCADAEDAMQRKAVLYDKGGDQHYDYDLGLDQVHARLGSRRLALLPRRDARGRRGPALHRAAHGHPRLRGRRQRRPAGAPVAVAAAAAVEHVGLPEGQYALAQAAIYLSLAPKSNAAKRAIGAARAHIRDHGRRSCRPRRCARRPTRRRAKLGRGAGLRLPARPPRPRSTTRSTSRGARGPAPLRARRRGGRAARAPGADPRARGRAD